MFISLHDLSVGLITVIVETVNNLQTGFRSVNKVGVNTNNLIYYIPLYNTFDISLYVDKFNLKIYSQERFHQEELYFVSTNDSFY